MKNKSFWIDTCIAKDFPALLDKRKCEVAVIGAGLTGVTTAYLLTKLGVDVILLEADKIGSGTTGSTTAKITVQHGLKYQCLSEKKAIAYTLANKAGLEKIAKLVSEHKIACDFSRLSSFVYTRSEEEIIDIEKEIKAYEKCGIDGYMVSKTDLPFKVQSAIVMENQAQFHPIKYLYALVDILEKNNCRIYEHSKVMKIEKGNPCTLHTQTGEIVAASVVFATNYPLIDFPGLFFVKLHQERSYIISTNAEKIDVRGMYINASRPVNSVRMYYAKNETRLLLGGYGHKTAKEDDAKSGYSRLKDFLLSDFSAAKENPDYQWSAQDCVTLDGIPYVGKISNNHPNIYIATGYAKWGMTNATAVAIMITDAIMGSNHIDEQVSEQFCPSRFTPISSAKNFFVQSSETIREFTVGNAEIPTGSFDDVSKGKGAVLRCDGKATAIYKDEKGNVYAHKAHCTHLGCPLTYNEAENSFDCPCHGSRFSCMGEVIEGPAKKSLEKI